VGAFLAGIVGAVVFGLLVNGVTVPGESDTHIGQALLAIPGSLLGLAVSYLYGARVDAREGIDHAVTHTGR
jgi:uncharacterized membrane protein YeaQ/YmgE (transglycosylase-associated protein family)